jgi:hypothetical protein
MVGEQEHGSNAGYSLLNYYGVLKVFVDNASRMAEKQSVVVLR